MKAFFNTEIVSPNYHTARDGNTVAVPKDYLSVGYVPPSFKISKDK